MSEGSIVPDSKTKTDFYTTKGWYIDAKCDGSRYMRISSLNCKNTHRYVYNDLLYDNYYYYVNCKTCEAMIRIKDEELPQAVINSINRKKLTIQIMLYIMSIIFGYHVLSHFFK